MGDKRFLALAASGLALVLGSLSLLGAQGQGAEREWTKAFPVEPGELSATGRNPFFILEPGYQLAFEGEEDGTPVALTITVLDETRRVDGIETRVVEERETRAG